MAQILSSVERIDHRRAAAEHADEIGNVVMEQDTGNDVLRRSDGQRRIDQAAVTGENMIDRNRTESMIEHGGVEQNES